MPFSESFINKLYHYTEYEFFVLNYEGLPWFDKKKHYCSASFRKLHSKLNYADLRAGNISIRNRMNADEGKQEKVRKQISKMKLNEPWHQQHNNVLSRERKKRALPSCAPPRYADLIAFRFNNKFM